MPSRLALLHETLLTLVYVNAGDGKTDYLVVNANTGSVTVYWNEGPDASFVNGWRFTPGGVIATGVPHANLRTLRFADMVSYAM